MDRAARHGPNRLQGYLRVHETVIGHLRYTGAIENDGLDFLAGADGSFFFDGELLLRDGVMKLTVAKRLEIVDGTEPADAVVQTASYSYNVSIVGFGNVFRYCSPHEDDGPVHHHQHHRHQYDPFGARPDDYHVTLITDGDWPTLGDVVQEADTWYWQHKDAVEGLRARGR